MINKALGIIENASEHGFQVDHLLEFCHWFMAVLGVCWAIFYVVTIYKFRQSKNPRANYHGVTSHASTHAEMSVILIEAVLLVGFAVPIWSTRVNEFPNQDEALRVRAIGEQFGWNFHYPGPDRKFGRVDTKFVTPSNPLGLDPNDPDGKDDVVSRNDLHVVEKVPVVLDITSKDVIHAISIKQMRVAQDAIPGSSIPAWFKPLRTGKFEIVCAQLCGSGHYSMRALCLVDDQKGFDEFIKEQSALRAPSVASN
jgi:cytochrome c oxidase subunit 2